MALEGASEQYTQWLQVKSPTSSYASAVSVEACSSAASGVYTTAGSIDLTGKYRWVAIEVKALVNTSLGNSKTVQFRIDGTLDGYASAASCKWATFTTITLTLPTAAADTDSGTTRLVKVLENYGVRKLRVGKITNAKSAPISCNVRMVRVR